MPATQVILLERIETLGNMGELVRVKPGFARNYLLPQGKALRATKENIAYFEAQKKHLEAENEKRRKEAEKLAKKLEDLKVPLIRQASESGQMYGSVNSRDIAEEITRTTDVTVERGMVRINQNFKFIGLFAVDIALHPEVKVPVTINIARSQEEAEIQEKTGKALIADSEAPLEEVMQETKEGELEAVLEEDVPEAGTAAHAAETTETEEKTEGKKQV